MPPIVTRPAARSREHGTALGGEPVRQAEPERGARERQQPARSRRHDQIGGGDRRPFATDDLAGPES